MVIHVDFEIVKYYDTIIRETEIIETSYAY